MLPFKVLQRPLRLSKRRAALPIGKAFTKVKLQPKSAL